LLFVVVSSARGQAGDVVIFCTAVHCMSTDGVTYSTVPLIY